MNASMTATSTAPTIPFKKLTPEERKQYMAEGHCFRCRLQGHMARECPKNTQRGTGNTSTAHAAIIPNTTNPTPPMPAIPSTAATATTTTPPPHIQKSIEEHFANLISECDDSKKADLLDRFALGQGFQDANL